MVRARRVAERWTDASITFSDEVGARQLFCGSITPVTPSAGVQELGERLGQTIRQRFHHDGVVIVMVALELGHELGDAVTGGDGKCPDEIADTALEGCDEIGQR